MVVLTISGFAADKPAAKTAAIEAGKINLYADANESARIIDKFDVSANLIPIFEEKGWIKVGNPKNGEVGWVNKEQCRRVTEAYYNPHVKSITINIVDSDVSKVQPSDTKIVAYRNDKQLSDKEAKELYKKMQKDQELFERQMDRLFNESLKGFPNFMLQ